MEDKKMMALSVSAMALVLLVMVLSVSQTDAITCSEAGADMEPCVPFLLGSSTEVASACCEGAKKLVQLATTTQIRRDLCQCFKTAAAQLHISPDKAKQLPQLCKISQLFPIDPKVDCSKIS